MQADRPGLEEQDQAVQLIASAVRAIKVYDLRSAPHSGYRAVHVIASTTAGLFVEVQVRTEIQEFWARLSESLTDRHGLALKYGGGPESVRAQLDSLSDWAWEVEQEVFRRRDHDAVSPWTRAFAGLPAEVVRDVFLELLQKRMAEVATVPVGD